MKGNLPLEKSRGSFHISRFARYSIFLLIVGLVILSFFYFKNRNKSNPLQKHLQTQSQITQYQISNYSSGRGTTTTTAVELKDNRFFLQTAEYIVVDNTLYYQDQGVWKYRVLDPQNIQQYQAFNPEVIKQTLLTSQLSSTYTAQGKETCGQLTCYKYTQADTKDPQAIRTLWFDTKNYLLRKDIFVYGEFTSENTYTYDPVSIQIPI